VGWIILKSVYMNVIYHNLFLLEQIFYLLFIVTD